MRVVLDSLHPDTHSIKHREHFQKSVCSMELFSRMFLISSGHFSYSVLSPNLFIQHFQSITGLLLSVFLAEIVRGQRSEEQLNLLFHFERRAFHHEKSQSTNIYRYELSCKIYKQILSVAYIKSCLKLFKDERCS